MEPELRGDPRVVQLGNYSAVKMPTRRVRVTVADWYGPGGKPVTEGEIVTLDSDLARAMVAFKRAEFVK
jgi:hypothetical protein